MVSSQGRSNLISETVSRQGKLAKKARAQSRRVMMFISLIRVSQRKSSTECLLILPDLGFFSDP